MRREGYELQVGQPKVIIKMIGGEKCEPIEILSVDMPEESSGKAIELITRRKGELLKIERKGDRVHMEFNIPSRGIIGLRNQMLTATSGEAIMTHRFLEFAPWKGEIEKRVNGSLIAIETGQAIAYALDKLQDRGKFFVDPGVEIYQGQVVGENTRSGDLGLNLTKTKKLTNMRASGSDEKMRIAPAIKFSLEEALEYIQQDEYVEVTPKCIRLRKIILNETERKRYSNANN
jgi:GTP-binding protein